MAPATPVIMSFSKFEILRAPSDWVILKSARLETIPLVI